MNILYLTQFFSSNTGGSEYVFYNLAQEINRRGHHVEVICHKLLNKDHENISTDVVVNRIGPTIEHRGQLPPSIRQNLLYIINAVITGSTIIKNRKIDIIHSNSYCSIVAGSILGQIHRKAVISTVHDVFTSSSPDSWNAWVSQNNASKLAAFLGPIFEKISLRMPSNVIHSVSEATRADIQEINHTSNIVVIPNGIDLSSYDRFENIPEFQKYVLFIGRLVYYKNLDVVISCFREVVRSLPQARLIVLGEGPMKGKWQELVNSYELAKNIEFKGFVTHQEKVMILSKCSALVFPSTFEGFGLVILESFALGKPAIVAKVKPFDEIVSDGKDGFLVDAQDESVWASRIISVLRSPELSRQMGFTGRIKVQTHFSLAKISNLMEALYEEVLGGKNLTDFS